LLWFMWGSKWIISASLSSLVNPNNLANYPLWCHPQAQWGWSFLLFPHCPLHVLHILILFLLTN
jgi:hypothetical protein